MNNIEAEKEAIKKVIIETADAYRAKDFERLAAMWVHDKSVVKLRARNDRYSAIYGWSSISTRYKADFEQFRNIGVGTIKKVGWIIKVDKTLAWAKHDQLQYNNNGDESGKQIITHLLEKHNGEWKIVQMSQIIAHSYN